MPLLDTAGMVLRTRDGHSEMASLQLKALEGGGYWFWVECRLERADLPPDLQPTYNPVMGHWLAQHYGSLVLQTEPYVWPDAASAWAAHDQWVRQQG